MHLCRFDTDDVSKLYEQHMRRDFPPVELRPLRYFQQMAECGSAVFYGFYDGMELAGYANVVTAGPDRLLDHFAILPEKRGRGLGATALAMLRAVAGDFFLEVEDPDLAENERDRELRLRRIAFYQRCGVTDTGYAGTAFGVPYLLLSFGDMGNPLAIPERMRNIYRVIVPDLDTETGVLYALRTGP